MTATTPQSDNLNMLLEHFKPQQFQDTLNDVNSEPEKLEDACFAYGQHRNYLDIETRAALDLAVLESPLRSLPETACTWEIGRAHV